MCMVKGLEWQESKTYQQNVSKIVNNVGKKTS
jgi:hypothetical protein